MFKFFYVLLAIVAGSAMAETVDLGSQYQHQAANQKLELTPGFGWKQAGAKSVSGNTATLKGWHGTLKTEYGVSDAMSIGFSFDYEYAQNSFLKTTQKGLHDPEFFLNTRNMVGPGSLRYGLALDFAVEDSIIGSSGDSNQASGGVFFTPYVGYEWQTGPHTMGARLSYMANIHDGKSQDKRSDPAVESRTKGGNSVYGALFYEADLTPLILGASVGVAHTDNTHTITAGVSTDGSASNSAVRGEVYGAWLMTSAITLLPKFAYQEYTAIGNDNTQMDQWELNVAGRFEF